MERLITRVAGLAVAAALVAPAVAVAQDWPTKPVELIVPFAAGGSSDTVARIVAETLGEKLGQRVAIVNKPGGRTEVGYKAAAAAAPDGYTFVMSVSSLVTNPLFYKNSFDASSLKPVIYLDYGSYFLLGSKSLPAKSVPELVDYIKGNPGKVSCALTGGLGSIGCEMIEVMSGGKLLKPPYRGSNPGTVDLIADRVNLVFSFAISSKSVAQNEGVKVLATTAPARGAEPFPDAAAVAETFPDFALQGWHGISAPAGTPDAIVAKMNEAINATLKDPEVSKKLRDGGVEPGGGTPDDYAKRLASLTETFKGILKASGVEPK